MLCDGSCFLGMARHGRCSADYLQCLMIQDGTAVRVLLEYHETTRRDCGSGNPDWDCGT